MGTPTTRRNPATVRATHWLTALSFLILFGTGAALYDHRPSFRLAHSTLTLPRIPGFLTITLFPKQLHYVFAALFVVAGVVYTAWALRKGHFRGIVPKPQELKAVPAMVAYYLRIRTSPPVYGRYNPLQQLTYAAVLFVLTPLIVVTGAAMLPLPLLHPVAALFAGGVKLWHFTCIALLGVFFVGHLLMVITTGLKANLRTML